MIRTIITGIYSAFWCASAIVVLMISPKSSNFVLLKMAKKYWSTPMLRWIVGAKIKVEISNKAKELFDQNKGGVIMANHSSSLDITAAFVATPAPIVFLAKASLRKVPFLGGANARVGTVFVDRGSKKSALKAITTLVETVKKGRFVLVFPEGARSKTGELTSFKKGGFHLAVQAEAPVIPMYIEGTHKRLSPGSYTIKRFKDPIVVKFGDPIVSSDVVELRNLSYNSICKLRG
jgi:1-acyl-sn-glycerol-3-phosphate acyltransferase